MSHHVKRRAPVTMKRMSRLGLVRHDYIQGLVQPTLGSAGSCLCAALPSWTYIVPSVVRLSLHGAHMNLPDACVAV